MNRHDRRKNRVSRDSVAFKARVGEVDLRYGERVVDVHVFINTDEDVNVLAKRIMDASRGPKLAMVVVAAGLHEKGDPSHEAVKRLFDRSVEAIEEKLGGESL